MPSETPSRIVQTLARHGYNADREAVTLLARVSDPAAAIEAVVSATDDNTLRITSSDVRACLDSAAVVTGAAVSPSTTAPESTPAAAPTESTSPDSPKSTDSQPETPQQPSSNTTSSTATKTHPNQQTTSESPNETEGSNSTGRKEVVAEPTGTARSPDRNPTPAEITGDITGRSTGTGEYSQFVTTFRDRYEQLSKLLKGRVNHRPATAIADMPGGSDAEMIGLVNDIRSTASGHWLIELEDTTGTFPALVMKDRPIAELVDELLLDECIAVQGTLADDSGILFTDSIHFPDVPRTFRPSTADRHVQAALISDVHVGSQEFMADAWGRFADWLHTEEAEAVEYLLIAGDMVEGVGVYPDQDEELDIVDIFDQYEAFSEYLKAVPGDIEIVMIPGNHDAVRLAEPQPGFDEELRDIMSVHDARITGNPSLVTIEGVSILMYHGVSLDEVIAELPEEKASYDNPHKAMYQLLKKRHVAPQYGGKMRLAPETKDYLTIDTVPDIFHTGHVHKLGWGKYHNVLAVNSGCWQAQTAFQKKVNIDPDVAHAPIVDLDTLEMTVRKFA
ncbi:DNA-directed DNA polymerase II small subunit [Halonotius aquaticus]|uniref:DNA polymerase II small subunit n=1 Tax=Halonotius aquaticus TaxID=2216978 RepID=A0A3A6PW52_9EURY|nr:DNA-directed DNA polymerase II small subunit [Halonotius aquaticus]RJX42511.1 DNA-directed DNA polymerase II small subunit [Halonotius aquaticus]